MSRGILSVMLICVALVLAAAVPLVAGTQLVTKGPKGPNASAVTWEYIPADDGEWTGHIVNNGLKSLVIEVCDNTSGAPEEISHQKIGFASYDAFPTGTVDTEPVIVKAGRTYSITATPNGPKGKYCTVDARAVPGYSAALSPPHSDHGMDIDANSKYDYLAIEISVEVFVAGNFSVSVDLSDSASVYIMSSSSYRYLSQGLQIVEVLLKGETILSSGLDGPYIAVIGLADQGGALLGTDTYHTAAYTSDQFQSSLARLAPPHSDYGLDTDGDGLYNYLVVAVCVDTSAAGTYIINSTLYDRWSETINWVSTSAYLEPGLQTVQIQFKGHTIHNTGIDGPYQASLQLTDSGNHPLDSGIHTTQAYAWSQFQPPVVEFAPPHSDHGLDTNGDGLYDFLEIDVSVSATVAETCTLAAGLYEEPWTGAYVGFAYNITYVELGIQIVPILVPGYMIYNSGISGSYWTHLSMGGPDGYWLQNDYYFTQDYEWNQFQPQSL